MADILLNGTTYTGVEKISIGGNVFALVINGGGTDEPETPTETIDTSLDLVRGLTFETYSGVNKASEVIEVPYTTMYEFKHTMADKIRYEKAWIGEGATKSSDWQSQFGTNKDESVYVYLMKGTKISFGFADDGTYDGNIEDNISFKPLDNSSRALLGKSYDLSSVSWTHDRSLGDGWHQYKTTDRFEGIDSYTGLNIAKCNRPYTRSFIIKVKEEGFITSQSSYTLMWSRLGTIEEFNAWLASEHPTLDINM